MFNQLFSNGIIAGTIYALVALGFTAIYRTVKFFYFTHGALNNGSNLWYFYTETLYGKSTLLKQLNNLTSQLIEKYKPEKIILFGSAVCERELS